MNLFSFFSRRLVLVLIVLSISLTPFFWMKFLPHLSSEDIFSFASESLEILQLSEPTHFFEYENSFEMNQFEVETGLFSFEYRNHLAVKKYLDIYYLEDLKNKRVVFQIFESDPDIHFDSEFFTCAEYVGVQTAFANKKVCFSKNPPENFVSNLELFGQPQRFLKKELQFFSNKGLIQLSQFNELDFFSRAEAVQFILALRYPQRDFSSFSANCFDDISKDHPYSGVACYAKQQGIMVGIGGKLYPEQSINLHGILKILFKVFEVEDYSFNEHFLDPALFEQMQQIHIAYPIIAKSYYEGLFTNLTDQIHWANRNVYKGEALQIIYRFIQWKEGRKFKVYDSAPAYTDDTFLYLKGGDFTAQFEENPDEAFDDNDQIVSISYYPYGLDTEIYFLDRGGIYRHLYTLKNTHISQIKSVFAAFDTQRLKGKLIVLFEDGSKKGFKLKQKQINFQSLKHDFLGNGYVDTLNYLEAAQLLPNVVPEPIVNGMPSIEIYMSEQDFSDIFIHRTGNNRYQAYLELVYPDGEVLERSILIKTRGNANRGYIKSGFTIEAFSDFKQSKGFEGDEFLKKTDEFKLRGFINEETMLHEKIFYNTFSQLGYYAPQFFDSTLKINGVPLGLYQITEAVKEEFFDYRELEVDDFYYARNSGSIYNTNLGYYESDDITLSQYKYKGDGAPLLKLIKRIQSDDETLMDDLNVQNIFDYAMTVFLMQANDSLTHNFYIYFDKSTGKWNIFPWDADDSLYSVKPFNVWEFLKFVQRDEGTFNQLIHYLFKHLSFEEVQDYMVQYMQNWNSSVDLDGYIRQQLSAKESYYLYDNALWNGKFLERKKYNFDTINAIKNLLNMVLSLQTLEEEGIGLK